MRPIARFVHLRQAPGPIFLGAGICENLPRILIFAEMIELSKHIECLLLRHNCVIVPGLGGFVTQYVPARYVPEEELFIPPFRSVGFNPRLTLNDGLLVQSYMQAYDTSYPETQRIVENAVAEVRAELLESGSFTFNGIGTLSLDAAGNYDFAPCEAGVLSPALYGLSSFTAQALEAPAECVKKEAPRRKRKMRVVKKSGKSYVFSINKELVNYVAAAVVAIVFYFAWAAPTTGDDSAAASKAVMFGCPQAVMSADKKQPAVSPAEARPDSVPASIEAQTVADSTLTAPAEVSRSEGKYTIVLASSVTVKNAENFVTTLKKKGYKEAEVYAKGRMTRVVYCHFPTEGAAYACLDTLRANREFSDAWVMALR